MRLLRRMGAMLVLAVLVALTLLVISNRNVARSNTQPQWSDGAGAANHMCYHHGGIKQFAPGTQGFGSASVTTVVCMNNWAYSLPNW